MTPNRRGMPIIGGILISMLLIILIPYFLVTTSGNDSVFTAYKYWLLFFIASWLGAIYILSCDVLGIYELTKLVKNKTLKKKLSSNIFTV